MEYAAGGELFERICNTGRFSEDEVKHRENDSFDIFASHNILFPGCFTEQFSS